MSISPEEYQRAWNERVGKTTAHLYYDEKYLPKMPLQAQYRKAVKLAGDLRDKKIIDFGCGGGLFGEYLTLDSIRKKYDFEYSGYDISERSCKVADERFEKANIYLFSPESIPHLKGDVLFCLSVIQHFPSQGYLDYFLDRINTSEVKTLIIHIRAAMGTDGIGFQTEPYATTHDINLACHVNCRYITTGLTNYKPTTAQPPSRSGFQYLRYDRK